MRITLPDGTIREYDQTVTGANVAAEIGAGLAIHLIGTVLGTSNQTPYFLFIHRVRPAQHYRTRG